MLIMWGLINLYLIVFFSIMGLVGAGYLVSFGSAARAFPEAGTQELAARGRAARLYGRHVEGSLSFGHLSRFQGSGKEV